MPDLLHGEVDLTGPPPAEEAAPVVEPAAEPEAVVEAAEEPAAEVAADPAAQPAPKQKRGLVEELIDERRERKALRERLDTYEKDPVLSRLTPDVRRAIAEGTLVVGPPKSNPDAERERLAAVAERYGLYTLDASNQRIPDLETAKRVDAGIRETVREEIAPIRNVTLADKAMANVGIAVQHATTTLGAEQAAVVKEEYDAILRLPNGAQMLSQPEVARTIWKQAIGTLHERGLLAGGAKPAPQKDPAAPVIPPVTGRRNPQAAIQLSPALQRVYKDAGLDPTKTPSASKMPTPDAQGYMSLED